jgi:hypothetical protein
MHPSKTVRLLIPDDACALARWLIEGDLVEPDDVLEFMRGDVVCLRGTAQAFARRMVSEGRYGPRHIPFKALDPEAIASLRRTVASPMRLNDDPLAE